MACRDERQHCGSCQVLAKAKGNGPFAAIACLPGAAALCTVRLQGCNVLARWQKKKAMWRLVLHAKLVRQPSAKHMQSRGALAIFAGMGCADRLRISAVSGIFRPCLFAFACWEPVHSLSMCVRKRNKWPEARRTPQPRWPILASGATRSMLICCLAQGLLCKSSICHVANTCRAGSPFFVFCFVFRALRLAATAFAQQGTRYEAFEQLLMPCDAAATA